MRGPVTKVTGEVSQREKGKLSEEVEGLVSSREFPEFRGRRQGAQAVAGN